MYYKTSTPGVQDKVKKKPDFLLKWHNSSKDNKTKQVSKMKKCMNFCLIFTLQFLLQPS